MTAPRPGGPSPQPRDTADTAPDGRTPGGPTGGCASCGAPQASMMDTPEGPARLCAPCATLHGLGCP
jgi:hypothetical protein